MFKHVGLDEEKEYFGLSFQDNKGQVVRHRFRGLFQDFVQGGRGAGTNYIIRCAILRGGKSTPWHPPEINPANYISVYRDPVLKITTIPECSIKVARVNSGSGVKLARHFSDVCQMAWFV